MSAGMHARILGMEPPLRAMTNLPRAAIDSRAEASSNAVAASPSLSVDSKTSYVRAPTPRPAAAAAPAADAFAMRDGSGLLPPALEAMDAEAEAASPVPPAKKPRAAPSVAAGVSASGSALPPRSTMWHYLNQQSAAALPPRAPGS